MMNQHLPTSATTGDARTLNVIECAGIRYCTVHDDFAQEGYDWGNICREAYWDFEEHGMPDERSDDDPPLKPCRLVPMFTEVTA